MTDSSRLRGTVAISGAPTLPACSAGSVPSRMSPLSVDRYALFMTTPTTGIMIIFISPTDFLTRKSVRSEGLETHTAPSKGMMVPICRGTSPMPEGMSMSRKSRSSGHLTPR